MKRAWFAKIVDTLPPIVRWARGYDLAISTRTTADYTASFLVGVDKNENFYIADGFRKRIDFPEQRRLVLGLVQKEPHVIHGVESALHGKALVQSILEDVGRGKHAIASVKVEADKVTRALAWASVAEEGKVFLVRGPWNGDLLEEAAAFPAGTHDDQIDAVSLAMKLVAKPEKRGSYGF